MAKINKQHTAKEEEQTPKLPLINDANPKENDTTKSTEPNKNRIKKFLDKYNTMEKTQIALVVCNIATVIIFFGVSLHQSSQTRESLDLAKQNYIEQNRPYVFTSTPTVRYTRFNEYVAYLPIINHGNTPAYRVYEAMSFQHWNPIPDPRNDKDYFISPAIYAGIIAPNSVDTMIITQHKTYWDTNSTSRYFIIGKIWYSDNWNSRQHYTTFAYEWIFRHDSFVRIYKYESADTNEQTQTNK